MMDAKTRDRVAKALRLLESDHEGERANAAAMLVKTMKPHGGMHELAKMVTAQPAQDPNPLRQGAWPSGTWENNRFHGTDDDFMWQRRETATEASQRMQEEMARQRSTQDAWEFMRSPAFQQFDERQRRAREAEAANAHAARVDLQARNIIQSLRLDDLTGTGLIAYLTAVSHFVMKNLEADGDVFGQNYLRVIQRGLLEAGEMKRPDPKRGNFEVEWLLDAGKGFGIC